MAQQAWQVGQLRKKLVVALPTNVEASSVQDLSGASALLCQNRVAENPLPAADPWPAEADPWLAEWGPWTVSDGASPTLRTADRASAHGKLPADSWGREGLRRGRIGIETP